MTAEAKQERRLSPIWFVPILAVVLGVYMVVHTWMTEGPTISITFKTAEGLEAGKTKVKYRNVQMGLVEEVNLSDDFKRVVAKVKLDRSALPLLRKDTRFWVVTARVGLGNISGLDTLLSGAYIQLAPGDGEPGYSIYTALEKPPLTPSDQPGLRLHLIGDTASSVSEGDAVMYKGYKVGRVEKRSFDTESRNLRYVIFIDAPFHELVDDSVRFWDVSGVSLSAGADGFKVETAALDTVLLGGVTFGTPEGIPPGEPVEHGTEFQLYPNYEDILKNPFRYGRYYVVSFAQSLKGLLPGAPVEYRGLPIGRVERLMIKELMQQNVGQGLESQGDPIPVLIYVEPGRMELPDLPASVDAFHNAITTGVSNGMRATLESGNLLTGAKYIGIDYFPDQELAEVGEWGGYPTIPTVGSGVDQILVKVNDILDKVAGLPLDETVANANKAIANLDKVLADLDVILGQSSTQELPAELEKTLESLQRTIDGLSPNSQLYQNLNGSLQQLNRTLSNMESLTRTLSGQPNAAIMPSQLPADPQPEARR